MVNILEIIVNIIQNNSKHNKYNIIHNETIVNIINTIVYIKNNSKHNKNNIIHNKTIVNII